MPVHDWTKTYSGIFHDFHQSWIISIRNALNDGLLPADFYAIAEQSIGGPIPDIVTLESSSLENVESIAYTQRDSVVAVLDTPPKTRYVHEGELDSYLKKSTRIEIRHSSGDRVVGFIEIVSPGNKQSDHAIHSLMDKMESAIRLSRHMLIVDLFPPTKRDTRGLHAEFWLRLFGEQDIAGCDSHQPLGMTAYHATPIPKAYFQPFAVGDVLIDMPMFLSPEHYINVPLEHTYQQAWNSVPKRWRDVIS